MKLTRRDILQGIIAYLSFTLMPSAWASVETSAFLKKAEQALQHIEKRCGGRLGVNILDIANNAQLCYRANERFPFCSTIKFLIVATILKRVEQGQEDLNRLICFSAADILSYAPVTKENLAKGSMSVEDLCVAAIEHSDNTAANLLLQALGGVSELNSYVRSFGDSLTHLDRTEPDLNSAIRGDVRDTTSPTAITRDMRLLLLNDGLDPDFSQYLQGWMHNATTGLHRLRAGLPSEWVVADKTGTGDNGTSNVIALIRRPNNPAPLLAAIYMTESTLDADARDNLIADIGRLITANF